VELNILYAGINRSWLSSIEFCWWHIKFVLVHCFSVDVHCVEWSTKCEICLIVELMMTGVIWDIESCWLVNSCQHFGSTTFFWDVSNYAPSNSETSQKAWIFKLINGCEHASKLDRTGSVPSVQQKSSGLKFSKSRTGSHVK